MTPFGPEAGLWWQTIAVLAFGGTGVAIAAGIAARMCRTAAWRQVIWRAAVVSVVFLFVAEVTGLTQLAAIVPLALRPAAATPPTMMPTDKMLGAVDFRLLDHIQPNDCIESVATGVERANHEPLVAEREQLYADSLERRTASTHSESAGGLRWPAMLWGIGCVAVLCRYFGPMLLATATSRRRFIRINDPIIPATTATLANRLGLRGRVRLLECARLASPAAFGVLRPTVVLPRGFAQAFTRRQQEAVLAHELAHLAAHDPFWQHIFRFVCAVLWWHPAVWWLARQARATNEAAADEASLLLPDGPSLLADSLVNLGRQLIRREQLGWLTLEGDEFRSGLGQRVNRLLQMPPQRWRRVPRGWRLTALMTLPVVCVVIVAASTAWARGQIPVRFDGGAQMNMVSVAWRGSLAAALWMTLGAAPAPATAADRPDASVMPSPAIELALAGDADKPEGDRKEPAKREGDRPRGDAEKPRGEGDRPRGDAERPREGDRPRGDAAQPRREGDRPRADAERPREGDRPRGEGERRDAPPPREGDRPRGDAAGEMTPQVRQMMQHRRELEEAAAQLRRRLGELKEGQADSPEVRELREKYERILRELREMAPPREGVRRPDAPRGETPREGVRRDGPRPDGPPREGEARGADREVQQLRNEVQQLRREMQELRELLRRMNEKQSGERR